MIVDLIEVYSVRQENRVLTFENFWQRKRTWIQCTAGKYLDTTGNDEADCIEFPTNFYTPESDHDGKSMLTVCICKADYL